MHKQQRVKEVSEMSASELVDHWQAEVNRLRAGFRLAKENMVPERKWTRDEAAQYAMNNDPAKENRSQTQIMYEWVTEYEAAQGKLEAAMLVLGQQRTGTQTNTSFVSTSGPASGDLRWEGSSGGKTLPDPEVEDDARSGRVAPSASYSASFSGWISRAQGTLFGKMRRTRRGVVDNSMV